MGFVRGIRRLLLDTRLADRDWLGGTRSVADRYRFMGLRRAALQT